MNISAIVEEGEGDSFPSTTHTHHIAKKPRVDSEQIEEDERISRRIWAERDLKTHTTIEQLLSARRVDEYVKKEKDLITIDSMCVISEALKTLIDNKIHSAPVYDSASKTYIGFINMLDILVWVMENFPEIKKEGRGFCDLFDLLKNEDKWFTTLAKDIIDESGKDHFKPLSRDATLWDATKLFGNGVHQIPVVGPATKTLFGILSQSQIIILLSMHLDLFGEVAEKTLAQLNLSSGVVLYAQQSDPTIDVFKMLSQWKFNGVPIVGDKETKILSGNLSAYDLRMVLKEHFTYSSLFQPVSHFIAQCRKEYPMATSPAVFCSQEDTLATAIRILASNHIHRMYVVDGNGKLTGVLTLCDILRNLPSYLNIN